MLAVVASQAHNLKVEGSSPSLATIKVIKKMGEEHIRQSKAMFVEEAPTLRGLADFANGCKIPREDIVTILPSKEGYVMIYYY